jgi:opacity protein-like surface antigen
MHAEIARGETFVMLRKTAIFASAALIISGLPITGVQAEGLYAGIGLGFTRADLDEWGIDQALADEGLASSTSTDDGGGTVRLSLGYEINRHFALEAGYVNFADVSAQSVITLPVSGDVISTADVNGLTLGVRAGMPVADKVILFAKAGLFVWDADWTTRANLSTGSGSSNSSDDGSDLTYGIGAEFTVADNLGVTIDWDRYDLGDDLDLSYDIYSVGLRFRF